ncbi:MAG: hypothetical protein LBC68_06595, partial [Prevotellaceae bacterium]|nr:hypothetical protein [Prevotellaceae bacterium]
LKNLDELDEEGVSKDSKQYKKAQKAVLRAEKKLNYARAELDEAKKNAAITAARIEAYKSVDEEGFAKINNLTYNGVRIDIVVTNVSNLSNPNAEYGYTYSKTDSYSKSDNVFTMYTEIQKSVSIFSNIMAHEFGHAFDFANNPRTMTENIDCQDPNNWDHPQVKIAIEWQQRYDQLLNDKTMKGGN